MSPMRVQYVVRFGYDGSRFRGLQPLPDHPTAGGAVMARLTDAFGSKPRALVFAARTDAGVHGLNNIATFWYPLTSDIDRQQFAPIVCASRDDGLWQVDMHEIPIKVHARGSSRGKRYRYLIDDGATEEETFLGRKNTHATPFIWSVLPRLDVERMRRAAQFLLGTHNFTSFRASGCTAGTPIKTIAAIYIGGPYLVDPALGAASKRRFVVEIVGTAFLRKMVRLIVGTLARIGAGWGDPDDVLAILAARDPQVVGLLAPAHGLCLAHVGFSWPPDGSWLLPEDAHLHDDPVALARLQAELSPAEAALHDDGE